RQGTADGIGDLCSDQKTWIGGAVAIGIVARKLELSALLPPAVLAANNSRRDGARHPRPGFDLGSRTLDQHPGFVLDPEALRRFGMNIGRRIGRGFPQARKAAQLAVNERCELRVGENERILLGNFGPADRAYERLDVFRQRWETVRRERMRIDLDFLVRRIESTGTAILFGGVLPESRRTGHRASTRRIF